MAAERITGRQWAAFWAAWLGWAFDGLDGFLYTLIAVPFVKQLLDAGSPQSEVAAKAALIQGVFLFGWAFGGAFFGRIGDKLGRAKTLSLTICVYALFTGAAFFAQTWWHLLIFRFLAALGIGGEWAAGSSLVAETFPTRHRHWASALLQSGYMVGMILAALTVGWMGSLPYRTVFLVGVLPALATIWIRRAVPEPEEWEAERRTTKHPSVFRLFARDLLPTTLLTLLLTSVSLTAIWAFLFFNNQVLRSLPEVRSLSKAAQDSLISGIVIVYTLWNIVGNFCAGLVAQRLGYRWAFGIYLAAAFACFYFGFRDSMSLEQTRFWFNATMFFGTGVFALFPLYIPPLFPTLVRTTGAGFCYNFGRVVAGIGTLFGATLGAQAGSPGRGIFFAGFLYLLGLVIVPFIPAGGAAPKPAAQGAL